MSGHVLSQPLFTLKISSSRVGVCLDVPHLIHGSLRRTRVSVPNGITVGSVAFAGLTVVTDRQTDRQTTLYSVCSNRPQPADVAMRPNVQLPTTLVVQVEQSVCVCVRISVSV